MSQATVLRVQLHRGEIMHVIYKRASVTHTENKGHHDLRRSRRTWIKEHVPDRGSFLMYFEGVSSKDDSLCNDARRICVQEASHSDKLGCYDGLDMSRLT